MTTDLQRAIEEFTPKLQGLSIALNNISKAARSMTAAIERGAERAYLSCHRRLPGSTRTARLRKKRRDLVMRWLIQQLEAAAA